ncbi:MAG: DUF4381 family protein [Gemmatimonadaceae bacterium]
MKRLWTLALLLGPAAASAQGGGQLPADSVRYGVTTSHDTVTVGEAFEVRVRVRAPVDATIRFPEQPDSTGTVQARDPRVIQITDSIQARDETAVYRVSAWDVETQPIILPDVVVSWTGGERRIPLGGLEVFVRSVLPADSTLRVPKPARPLWEPRAFPWWLLAALLAAAIIGALLWWWWRRRRRPRAAEVLDPYAQAQREFNRLDAMGLVDAGERTRFAALAVEVLRDYLVARYPDLSLALTSREVVAMIRRHPTVPAEQLSRVLHEADLAKFAGFSLVEERARNLARDARGIVEHDHAASQPPAQAAA